MDQALQVAVVLIGFGAATIKVRSVLRAATDRWLRVLVVGVAAMTLALVFRLPAVIPSLPGGHSTLMWPLQAIFSALCAWLVTTGFLAALHEGDDSQWSRPWLWMPLAATLLIVMACWASAPDARDWVLAPEGRVQAGGPGLPVADLAYAAHALYLLSVVVTLFWLSIQAAAIALRSHARWLAAGFSVHAAGEVVMAFYSAHVVVYAGALWAGTVPPWREGAIEAVILPIGAGLCLIGLSTAAVASAVRTGMAPLRWLQYTAARRRLMPLWREVTAALPKVVLERTDQLRRRHRLYPHEAVHRMLIELSDGQGLLRAMIPPPIRERIRDLARDQPHPRHADTTCRAVELMVGLQRRAGGQLATSSFPAPFRGEWAESVRHWRRVAKAFRRSGTAECAAQIREEFPEAFASPQVTQG